MVTEPEDAADGGGSGDDQESDARHPIPSRDNVIEFLQEADHEDDLDQAGYWVHRALAETLLLLHDARSPGR